MTTEISGSKVDLSLLERLYGPSTNADSEPSSDLGEIVLGNYPPIDSPRTVYQQPIAMCIHLEPLPNTPQSQPAHERGPNFFHCTDQ